MKKVICTMLSILFVLSILPFGVFAAEESSSEHNRLMKAARDVFPEFSDKLESSMTSPRTVMSCSNEPSEAIVSETKLVDDYTLLTYQENSDGNVYVIEATSSSPFTSTYYITDSATGTGYASRTITIRVTATFTSQVFIADNVSFTQIQGGGAALASTGSFSRASTRGNIVANHSPLNVSKSSVFVLYHCIFDHSTNPINAEIDLTVTEANFSIRAYTFV